MIWLWCTRVIWALFPVTTGTALGRRNRQLVDGPAALSRLCCCGWSGPRDCSRCSRPDRGVSRCCASSRRADSCVCSCRSTSTSAASAALALVGSGFAAVARAVGADRGRHRQRARVRRRTAFRLAHSDAAAARPDTDCGRARRTRCRDWSVAPGRRALRRRRDRGGRSGFPLAVARRARCCIRCRVAGSSRSRRHRDRRPAHAHRTRARAPRTHRVVAAHGRRPHFRDGALDLRLGHARRAACGWTSRSRSSSAAAAAARTPRSSTTQVVAVAVVRADAALDAGPQPPHQRLTPALRGGSLRDDAAAAAHVAVVERDDLAGGDARLG